MASPKIFEAILDQNDIAASRPPCITLAIPQILPTKVRHFPSVYATPVPLPGKSTYPPNPVPMSFQEAKAEARARIIWGEPREKVAVFLQQNGFSEKDVHELLAEWNQERADAVRSTGIKKATIGALLVPIPLITYIVFMTIGSMHRNLFAVACAAGMFGLWKLGDGLYMILAPRSERGDISSLSD
jgi:hypothetical protein